MAKRNAFYAQSGGVTAVINASAAAVIETARKHRTKIGKVYAGRNGIIGALTEDLIDTSRESATAIAALCNTPGGAFGSCRYKLKGVDEGRAAVRTAARRCSARTTSATSSTTAATTRPTRASRSSQMAEAMGYPLTAVHVPKTVDNDLPITDNCPGFGSVAKYVATSMREAAFDVASMAKTSTRVFVLEVMGRHAGWITAAVGMAEDKATPIPLVLLFPEIAFDEGKFLAAVDAKVKRYGYCCVGVSEGLQDASGKLMAEAGTKDAFGHAQLGRVGPLIASHRQGQAQAQVSLGGRRLPAARGAPPCVQDRSRAELRGGQGRGRHGARGEERGDAGDHARLGQALSLEDHRGAARQGRQRREDAAPRFHHRRRLRHHRTARAATSRR